MTLRNEFKKNIKYAHEHGTVGGSHQKEKHDSVISSLAAAISAVASVICSREILSVQRRRRGLQTMRRHKARGGT